MNEKVPLKLKLMWDKIEEDFNEVQEEIKKLYDLQEIKRAEAFENIKRKENE